MGKKEDDTQVSSVNVAETPTNEQVGSSYFDHPPEPAHKLERRPQLHYQLSEFELHSIPSLPESLPELSSPPNELVGIDSGQHTDEEALAPPENVLSKMTFSQPKSKRRIATSCLWAFALGFSDGAPGALLPYMEQYYDLNYSEVSMIWICNAIGVLMIATVSHRILKFLGFTKTLEFATCCAICMYSIVSTGTKFPVICFAFFIGGIGVCLAASQLNVFNARFEKDSLALAYFHGSYGFGATVSPLIGTAFVESGYKWHTFYFVLLALMVVTLVNVHFNFAGADKDMEDYEAQDNKQPSLGDLLLVAIKNRNTWILAVFLLFYVGSEVSVGAWVVTYIRDYRGNTSTSVGYVVSGYWLGLTMGRLVLTPITHRYLGPRQGNLCLILLSLLFVGLTWAIPSTVAEGVCVSIAGLWIGPIYPLMITLVLNVIPRKIQVVSLLFAGAFGLCGGAFFPFIIGVISEYAGAFVVFPTFLAMFVSTFVLWLCLPKINDGKGYNTALRQKIICMLP